MSQDSQEPKPYTGMRRTIGGYKRPFDGTGYCARAATGPQSSQVEGKTPRRYSLGVWFISTQKCLPIEVGQVVVPTSKQMSVGMGTADDLTGMAIFLPSAESEYVVAQT